MTTSQRVLRMLRRNALAAIPTVLAIVVLNFFLLQLVPGDAADVLAGESGSATEETMRQLRTRFGLDLPLVAQLQSLSDQSGARQPRLLAALRHAGARPDPAAAARARCC